MSKARDTIEISSEAGTLSSVSTSTERVAGDGGNISIEAEALELMGGLISSRSITTGNGGNIDIKARDTIKMSFFSLIDTSTQGPGDAGNISIEAGNLELMGAQISSASNSFLEGPPLWYLGSLRAMRATLILRPEIPFRCLIL